MQTSKNGKKDTGLWLDVFCVAACMTTIVSLVFLSVFSVAFDFAVLTGAALIFFVCLATISSIFLPAQLKAIQNTFVTCACICALSIVLTLCIGACAKSCGAQDETFNEMRAIDVIATTIKMPQDEAERVTEATKAVIAYRFDCESCSRYIDDLKTLQQRLETDGLGDVPFVCTRSERGREIVAASNIREVPCVLVSNGDGTWTAVGVTTEEPSDVFANMTTIVFDVDSVAASVEAEVAD